MRKEWAKLIHNVIDAASYNQGEQALEALRQHPFGVEIAYFLNGCVPNFWRHRPAD